MGKHGARMIVQELQSSGSWQIRLRYPTYSRLKGMERWATIYVFWSPIDHESYTDAQLGTLADYAGVLLNKQMVSGDYVISGADLSWWLGDLSKRGAALGTNHTVGASTAPSTVLSDIWALSSLQNPGLTLGNVTDPANDAANPTWSGGFDPYTTLREVLDRLATDCNCSWRVNPDGTIDFGPASDLYTVSGGPIIGVPGWLPVEPWELIESVDHVLTDLLLDTDDATAFGTVASIAHGYDNQDYKQTGIVETAGSLDDADMKQMLTALLDIHSKPRTGTTFRFEHFHRMKDELFPGDTVDIYHPDSPFDITDYRETLDGNLPITSMVVGSRAMPITKSCSVILVDNVERLDLSSWVVSEESGNSPALITWKAGNDRESLANQLTGSSRLVADLAGGNS